MWPEKLENNSSEETASICSTCTPNGVFLKDSSTDIVGNVSSSMSSLSEAAFPEDTASVWLWKVLPPILFCFGIIGNTLTIRVLTRLGLKRQPTLVFLLWLAINDSVVLLTGLPRYWISYMFEYDLKTTSNASCKLYYFFIYLSMQYSSWILVGVTLERVIKTHLPFKYNRIYSSKKVAIGLLITLFVLVLVNFHFFFTNGINDYTEGDCGSLNSDYFYFDEHVFIYIDFSVLCIVPFLIMLVCNIFLVRILRKAMQNRESMMHHSMVQRANRFSIRMTKMLVVCTFYFLIATAPISIYFIIDTYLRPGYEAVEDNLAIARLDLVMTTTYLLQFSNYCINFYLYTAMNDRFYKEFQALIHCKPSVRTQRRVYSIRPQGSVLQSSTRTNYPSSQGLDVSQSEEDNI